MDEQLLMAWEDQVAPEHAALVMVDLQNDYVHPEGWVARQQVGGFLGDTGIEAALARSGELVAAARSAGVLRVFVQMIGDDRYLSAALKAQYLRNHGHQRPDCTMEGTWGADFHESVAPCGGERELVVVKHRYSAFIGTRLDLLLRSHGVRGLVICGVATSGCVESTIRDGFMLDHHVVVAADACADYDAARHTATLTKMDLSFGHVVPTADIVARWTAG